MYFIHSRAKFPKWSCKKKSISRDCLRQSAFIVEINSQCLRAVSRSISLRNTIMHYFCPKLTIAQPKMPGIQSFFQGNRGAKHCPGGRRADSGNVWTLCEGKGAFAAAKMKRRLKLSTTTSCSFCFCFCREKEKREKAKAKESGRPRTAAGEWRRVFA